MKTPRMAKPIATTQTSCLDSFVQGHAAHKLTLAGSYLSAHKFGEHVRLHVERRLKSNDQDLQLDEGSHAKDSVDERLGPPFTWR